MHVSRLVAAMLIAASTPAFAQQPATTEPPKPAPPPPGEQPKTASTAPPALPFTIYGTLNLNFQSIQALGATTPAARVKSRWALSPDSTNLGVRGSVDVREWFQIVFQCETSANVDGIFSATPFSLCNRNSRLGVAHARYGTLFYGNWDTPYKAQAYGTKADDPFLSTDVYGFDAIMGSPGFNYMSSGWVTGAGTAIRGFDIRASNSVGYQSPRWAGVSFKLQMSANEFKNASGTQDPFLYSAVVNYDAGPISASAAWERHEDGFGLVGINPAPATAPAPPATFSGAFGSTAANTAGTATASAHSTDTAWRLAAGYGLVWGGGETTLSAMFEQLQYQQKKVAAGAVNRYRRAAWQVGAKHRWGDHELRARFSMANKGNCDLQGPGACSTSGYGASDVALGYAYYFLKNAHGYVYYTRINNSRRAQYTFATGGSSIVSGATPAGADPQALGVGLRYAF